MSLLALFCTLAYPTVPSDQFSAEFQRKALAATVRIVLPNKGDEGTGVVVGCREKMVFVLTANHVVGKVSAADVQTFSDGSYPKSAESVRADVWLRWPDEDLALLRAIVETPPNPLRICPPALTPDRKTFSVLTVGCTDGAEPTCVPDQVERGGEFGKRDGSKVLLWQTAKPSVGGRSGGPLIDRRGYVVGICSGTAHQKNKDGPKGFYTHLTAIQAALDNEGVSWLYADPPKTTK